MKFKEFLTEGAVSKEAFAAWKKKLNISLVSYQRYLIVENGKIMVDGASDTANIFSQILAKRATWSSPFKSTAWDDAIKVVKFSRVDFPNFQNLPDVEALHFEHGVITSIKGIETLHKLEALDFVLMEAPQEPFGVLRFLKVPNLKEVNFRDTGWFKTPDAEADFEHIIQTHLSGDRDIIACQTELIDAGFEEWAEL